MTRIKLASIAAVLLTLVSCSKENAVPSTNQQASPLTFTAGIASAEETPQSKVAINIYENASKAKVVFTEGDYIYVYSKYYTWIQYTGPALSDPYTHTVTLKEEDLNDDGTVTFTLPALSNDQYTELNFLSYDNLNTISTHADYLVNESEPDLHIQTRADAFNHIVAGRTPHLSWAKCSSTDKNLTFKNILSLVRYTVNSSNVKYVVFTGNDGEGVIGSFVINFRTNNYDIATQHTSARSDVTPGTPGYIALAPGLDLSKGFTVNAYGADDQILFSCRSDKEFKTTAGKIVDLGELDDRASLYAMYQDGQDIQIGGLTYNKSTHGDATLISKGGQIPPQGGVYFIKDEASADLLVPQDKLILISDNIAGKRAKVHFKSQFSAYQATDIAFKNIEFDTLSDKPIFCMDKGQVGNFVMEGCKVTLNAALVDMAQGYSIDNLILSGNDFIITAAGNGLILTGDKTDESSALENYDIHGNAFWSSTPMEWHIIKSDVGKGLRLKTLNLSDNTFYNLYSGVYSDSQPKAFVMLGQIHTSATFGANIVYTGTLLSSGSTPDNSTPIVYLAGCYLDTAELPAQTIFENGTKTKWYGTSALMGGSAFFTGGSSSVTGYVRLHMTNLTEDPFTAIDLTTGKYELKEAYKGFGATR